MMEAKVKRDFDLKGEVYETFRDNNDVFLTNTQIYEIFEKFWADNCSDLISEKNPVLYIVGAQPGAGKTGLVEKLEEETGLPVLTGDQYRDFHPNAKLFSKQFDYTKYTSPINFLMCMLTIARCFDNKIGFIMENPLKNPQQNADYIMHGKKIGYSINLVLMAVKKYDSFLGVYNRGAGFLKEGKEARFTTNKTHDECYDGVLKMLTLKEAILNLNSLVIYDRNLTELVHISNISIENLDKIISFSQLALISERLRPHTEQEKKVLEEQKALVLECIDKGLIPIGRQVLLQELESRKETEKSLDK